MSVVPFQKTGFAVDSDALRFFQRHPLLAGVEVAELNNLARAARTERYPRRQEIWSPSSSANTVHFVRSGVVRVGQITANKRELTTHLLGRYSVHGVEALIPDATRQTVAVAHEDVLLYAVPRDAYLRLLEARPDVGHAIGNHVTERRRRLDSRLATVAYMTARARVASVILELAETFGVKDSRGTIVNVRLTHREMAALIGATRETVSFAILAFRKAGVVQTEHKRVVIVDEASLRREAIEG